MAWMKPLPPKIALRPGPQPRRAVVLLVALLVGLAARQWAFAHTEPMRRETTQRNAFYWGDRMVREAHPGPGAANWPSLWRSYVSLYESQEVRPPPEGHVLDYVPLRLLMAGVWVNGLNVRYGPVFEWRPEFARSFAGFSTAMELLAAAALFAVVARWSCRIDESQPHPLRRTGWTRFDYATAAAILLWLNPASIIDSNVWPHGQTWVLAAYLLSVLAMVENRPFLAGAVFGLGGMLKGQMMMVAPMLILWPLFDRRWAASIKVVGGMAVGIAAVVWPWIARGSLAWATAGFAAKIEPHDVLRKELALNLPAVLAELGHMTLHQHLIDLHVRSLHAVVELKAALIGLYAVMLIWCSRGIARLARTRDRRLLVAIAAPWALMFFIVGQMDERYLVWGACFTAGAVAVGRRALVAHAMLTWSAAAVNCQSLLYDKPRTFPLLMHTLHALNPLTMVLTTIGVAILVFEACNRDVRVRRVVRGGSMGPDCRPADRSAAGFLGSVCGDRRQAG